MTRERMGRLALLIVTALALPGLPLSAAEVALRLAGQGHHQATVTSPTPDVFEIVTTGGDPFVITTSADTPANLAAMPVLAFEYICVTGLDHLEVFGGPTWSEDRRVGVPVLPAREGWSPFAIDVSSNRKIRETKPATWRIDLGSLPGKVIQIRNLRLRLRTPAEWETTFEQQRQRERIRILDEAIAMYVGQSPHHMVHAVNVAADTITISGTVPSIASPVVLAEWPVWQQIEAKMHFADTWPIADPGFTTTVPRFTADGRDRALSRFVVILSGAQGDLLLSHARWADTIPSATMLPICLPRSKKGLGGFSVVGNRPVSDLDELGIGSITVNVTLSSFFQSGPGDGAEAVSAGGKTWYVRAKGFDGLDQTMLEAAKRNILVLGIILVPPARSWGAKELGTLMQHPDYESAGIFTMPNLTTAESVAAYTLALDLLAKRYMRADGRYGRMHHWIMHNEVDMGYVWTNCGKKPVQLFFDQYYRSMRLAHAIARRQDPNAQVFISLTHHWEVTGDPETCFPSRGLLAQLIALSRAEGDFDWGIAYHPYPSSLLEPRTWLDKDAQFALNTPKITFRNIEVLDAWARQPGTMFQGKRMRAIHLSEQGPNSPDYSEKSLTEQAAAMAYVWKKIARLDSILGFQYHNWVDNRHEGGLRIGLRRFPDDQDKPLGTKPVWNVYKALGTQGEDAACEFALPVIGLKDWSEAIHRGPIPTTKSP